MSISSYFLNPLSNPTTLASIAFIIIGNLTAPQLNADSRPDPSKDFSSPLSDEVSLPLIWVGPGDFTMGSPASEPGRNDDEIQHQVTFTSGYWLGKYEVTQAQWEAVMGTSVRDQFKAAGRGTLVGEGPNIPIYFVSWEESMEFCRKLTAMEKTAGRLPEGFEYTLPTEAQWENACRAGTDTATSGGGLTLSPNLALAPELDAQAWYYPNCTVPEGEQSWSGTWTPKDIGQAIEITIERGAVQAVGGKQANAWGFHDMHGNVWELCLDWYGDYPTTSAIDPQGPSSGDKRVKRGGSWAHPAVICRSANRHTSIPDFQIDVLGFRVALSSAR